MNNINEKLTQIIEDCCNSTINQRTAVKSISKIITDCLTQCSEEHKLTPKLMRLLDFRESELYTMHEEEINNLRNLTDSELNFIKFQPRFIQLRILSSLTTLKKRVHYLEDVAIPASEEKYTQTIKAIIRATK